MGRKFVRARFAPLETPKPHAVPLVLILLTNVSWLLPKGLAAIGLAVSPWVALVFSLACLIVGLVFMLVEQRSVWRKA